MYFLLFLCVRKAACLAALNSAPVLWAPGSSWCLGTRSVVRSKVLRRCFYNQEAGSVINAFFKYRGVYKGAV